MAATNCHIQNYLNINQISSLFFEYLSMEVREIRRGVYEGIENELCSLLETCDIIFGRRTVVPLRGRRPMGLDWMNLIYSTIRSSLRDVILPELADQNHAAPFDVLRRKHLVE